MKKAVTRKAAARPAPKKKPVVKKTALKRAIAKQPRCLWPAVTAGLAATGDAAAAGASLLETLAPKGDATGLYAHLAHALGTQLARATAAARKRAAQPLGADALDAVRDVFNILRVYVAAASVVRARSAEIADTWAALAPAKYRQFQSGLTRLALAVTRERNTADVPALMSAAVDRVISEAAVPKKRKARALA
jgi:hypothetical protein